MNQWRLLFQIQVAAVRIFILTVLFSCIQLAYLCAVITAAAWFKTGESILLDSSQPLLFFFCNSFKAIKGSGLKYSQTCVYENSLSFLNSTSLQTSKRHNSMNERYECHVLLLVRLGVLCRYPPVCQGHCAQWSGKKSLETDTIWIYSAIEKRECGKLLGGFTSQNNKALVIWIEALCIHWPCVTFENHYVGKPRLEDTKELGVGSLVRQSDIWSSVLIVWWTH